MKAKGTEIMPGIWTELLAKERVADLCREAERGRILRLARTGGRDTRTQRTRSVGRSRVGIALRAWLDLRVSRRASLRRGGDRA